MENQQEYALMKARGYRGVIATGLRLYATSFRKVFKATWLYTLLFSLVAAAIGVLLTTQLLPVGLQMAALPQYKWLLAQEHWPLITAVILLFVINCGLLVFIYRAAGRGLSLFRSLRATLKAALRHWLLTLGIVIAGGVVMLFVCLLCSLPVIILTMASLQAQMGTLIGDPLGMPSYLAALAGGTWLLTAFLQAYILLSLLFVGYYAYGSAETQQQEREQQKLNIPS